MNVDPRTAYRVFLVGAGTELLLAIVHYIKEGMSGALNYLIFAFIFALICQRLNKNNKLMKQEYEEKKKEAEKAASDSKK